MREIKERYLKNVGKEQSKKSRADNRQDSSDSESSVRISSAKLGVGPALGYMKEKIEQREREKAKAGKVWKVKSDKPDRSQTYAEVASSSDRPSKSTNRQPEAKRQTSKYAKEMLKDADLARQVYDRIQMNLTQDFTNMQWWQRPEGDISCTNEPTCGSTNAIFWCHVCGSAYCLKCRHNGEACNHDISCYSSELSDFFTPDSIGAANSPFDIEELIEETLGRAPYFGESKSEQSDYRKDQYNDLVYLAEQGASVSGNTFLKAYLNQGIEEFAFADYIYLPEETAGRIPTLHEHFVQMKDYSALPIWRPKVLVNCKYSDLTDEEYKMLLELYRSVMIPRSSHISGNYRTAETCHFAQKESYHITLLNLNLGHINRQPVIAGNHKFPSYMRQDSDLNTTLPFLVLQNGAHITTLCEASDDKGGIERHGHIAEENGVLGMVVHAEKTAPSVACFIYGTHDNGHFIELLGQFQYETENKEEHNRFSIMHACIFRLAFGRNTSGEMIDPTTGIWTSTGDGEPSIINAVAPAASEVLASTTDHTDVCILAVQGSTDIESCDPFKPTSGADRYDVRRMGIAECRVAVFHISSYAWRNAYEETCRRWAGFITQCLIHQVDFVQGDGNLFAQRNFKRDVHSDYRTCILVDILNRCLTEINLHRTPTNRITYNICSSTSAAEYIKAQEGNHTANTDSMVTISLCYGKQVSVLQERMNHESASADGYYAAAYEDEVILNDVEQPKHLMVYDLGLSDGDAGWHSPLLVMASLRCMKNRRPRTQEADKRRRQKFDDHRQERAERRDDLGPLPGDMTTGQSQVVRYQKRCSRPRLSGANARTI